MLFEQPTADRDRSIDERSAQPFEHRSIELEVDIDDRAIERDRIRNDARRGSPTELDLRLLDRAPKLAERWRVVRISALEPNAVPGFELVEQMIEQRRIEITTTQEVVPVVADDAQETCFRFEQRHVEGSPAQVIDQPVSAGFAIDPAANADATGSWISAASANPASRAASLVAEL